MPMKICVVGAGAIGGYLAGKLAQAGHEVSLVARGEHLAAIKANGLTLIGPDGIERHARVARASSDPSELGEQDCVLLAVKAHQVTEVAPALSALYGPSTAVVTLQNGIPWWYFHKHGGALEGRVLSSVDPNASNSIHIPPERVIGAVANKSAHIARPGVIGHSDSVGDSFPLGELDGSSTQRVLRIATVLEDAGVKSPVTPDIRGAAWFKLWGNLFGNPVCALAQANCLEVHGLAETYELGILVMEEARLVADKLGVTFSATPAQRMARLPLLGPVRPSMLQDAQNGRALEVEPLLGTVVELAKLTGTKIPRIETLYACSKLLSQVITSNRVAIVPRRLGAEVA